MHTKNAHPKWTPRMQTKMNTKNAHRECTPRMNTPNEQQKCTPTIYNPSKASHSRSSTLQWRKQTHVFWEKKRLAKARYRTPKDSATAWYKHRSYTRWEIYLSNRRKNTCEMADFVESRVCQLYSYVILLVPYYCRHTSIARTISTGFTWPYNARCTARIRGGQILKLYNSGSVCVYI